MARNELPLALLSHLVTWPTDLHVGDTRMTVDLHVRNLELQPLCSHNWTACLASGSLCKMPALILPSFARILLFPFPSFSSFSHCLIGLDTFAMTSCIYIYLACFSMQSRPGCIVCQNSVRFKTLILTKSLVAFPDDKVWSYRMSEVCRFKRWDLETATTIAEC